jgi:5-hydroxyisourate hydrolase-like protein (transthyretin family)
MANRTQKTEQERIEFKDKFAEIVSNNVALKGRYKIQFNDIGDYTHFFISDNDDRFLDVIKILSKREYDAYVELVSHWSK